jgi:hypothetical protein
MDSRPGTTTIDGNFRSSGPIGSAATSNVTVAGRGGVPPTGAGSVALNVTATNPSAGGYFTIWPTGQGQPNASNLNFVAGQTIPNMVIVPLGAGGQISIFNETGTTDVIVDVLGWFPTGPSFTGLTPARLMDSRIPPAPPQPPPPPPPAELTFSAGTHLVNASIPPGRYFAINAKSGCYWERLRGLGGTLEEIISNDFRGFAGRVIVDIRSTDVAFKFDADCGQFKSTQPAVFPASVIPPGTHVVGTNIVSGTYTTAAASGCYWERLQSFDGLLASIIANEFVSSAGTQYVTISSTDTGFTSDAACGTWTRVG